MNWAIHWRVSLSALGLAGLLAACGAPRLPQAPVWLSPVSAGQTQASVPTPKPSPSTKATKKPVKAEPSAKPSTAVTPKPAPSPSVEPLYRKALTRYRSLRTYTADVQSYGKSQGKDIGAKAKLVWKAPSRLRVEILDTNIQNGDRTVIVDSSSGVRAKAPGWWPFPVSVERTDPKLQLPGGPRYDEATIGGVLAAFEAEGAEIAFQGEMDFLGQQVHEFKVRTVTLTARGISHARIGLDPGTGLPVFCEQLSDTGIATQLIFSNVATDVPVADDRFSL